MRRRGRCGERGSATVWSTGIVAVLMALFAGGLLLVQAVVLRHRAGAAADLAALAAADHALDGREHACSLAREVAAAQDARLTKCAVVGEIADVVVEVHGVRVRSRAGPPLPADSLPTPPVSPTPDVLGVQRRGPAPDTDPLRAA